MKKLIKTTIVVCMLLSTFFLSCSDFIEPDITNKKVVLLTPAKNSTQTIALQQFKWEELEGARNYKLQVVKGTFSNIIYYSLDTLISSTSFLFQLDPGNYTWRVRGENNGYKTEFNTWTFKLDSTSDLSQQVVVLTNPIDNFQSNVLTMSFSWQSLYSADNYQFRLSDNNGVLISDTVIYSNSVIINNLSEAVYNWKVKALNSISQSQFSERTITIDLTAPIAPYNLLPAFGSTVSLGDSLTWSTASDAVIDSVYIATDSLFNNLISINESSSPYILPALPIIGNYYWKVLSLDEATNSSSFSITNRFYFQ